MHIKSINGIVEILCNYLAGVLFGGEHHFLVL